MTAGTLTVRLAVADPDELRSLDDWLRGADLGRITFAAAPPAPGALGSIDEELLVTLADRVDAAALAASVELWLRLRPSGLTLFLRIGDRPPVMLDAAGGVDVLTLLKAAFDASGGRTTTD
ncbi:hypothetical protein GCM10027589_45030 [Actinocorallia lasiicapitis]